jgi:hypothetical protein
MLDDDEFGLPPTPALPLRGGREREGVKTELQPDWGVRSTYLSQRIFMRFSTFLYSGSLVTTTAFF